MDDEKEVIENIENVTDEETPEPVKSEPSSKKVDEFFRERDEVAKRLKENE